MIEDKGGITPLSTMIKPSKELNWLLDLFWDIIGFKSQIDTNLTLSDFESYFRIFKQKYNPLLAKIIFGFDRKLVNKIQQTKTKQPTE